MKLLNRLMTAAALAAMVLGTSSAVAQDWGNCQGQGRHGLRGVNDGNCGPCPAFPCPDAPPGTDCIGAVGPDGKRYLGPGTQLALAVHDKYSPQRLYAYGRGGLDATRFDYWNRQQAVQYSWHGGYNYWRYGQPTALVVPPTATFQTEYNWGVAQTRTLPIYHQYTGDPAQAGAEGAPQPGQFANPPYWPFSTSQLGIYPVRGPW